VEPTAPRFDARDYLRIINKRKWFVIVIGVAAMLLGGVYAVSYRAEYQDSSLVWIRPQPQQFFWAQGGTAAGGERVSLETQAALAGSARNAAKTAERLASRTSGQRIIVNPREIADSITVQVMRPDRIRIQAVHPIERYAIAFANETAETFVETSADLRRSEERNAVEFLEDQLDIAQAEYEQALREKQKLQKRWGISNPRASEALLSAIEQYKSSVSAAQAQLAATNAQIAALRAKYASTKQSKVEELIAANPLRAQLQQELNTTRLALIKLKARYTPDHPAIQQLTSEADELAAQIQQLPATIPTTVVAGPQTRQQVKAQLDTALVEAAQLRGRIAALQDLAKATNDRLLHLMDKEATLAQLADKANLSHTTYGALLQELRDNKLREATKQGTAQILDYAIRAHEIKPSVIRALIFSGMLGLFAGIMLSLLLEALDETMRSPDDILRQTEVDFLGIVPWAEQEPRQLVTLETPKSPPAEAFRTLRSNINFALVDTPAKTFLITSAGAGEGKSLVTANLAVVFAQAGQSVILVDTDLRRPALHRFMNCDSALGLTNVLVGELPLEEALQETEVDNLKFLASGPLPPNPAELLDSSAMSALISSLREQADIVLFDSPPAIMLTDAIVLASRIEQTILVAEAGQVTRRAFNEMVPTSSGRQQAIITIITITTITITATAGAAMKRKSRLKKCQSAHLRYRL